MALRCRGVGAVRSHPKYLSEYAHPLIDDAYEWSLA